MLNQAILANLVRCAIINPSFRYVAGSPRLLTRDGYPSDDFSHILEIPIDEPLLSDLTVNFADIGKLVRIAQDFPDASITWDNEKVTFETAKQTISMFCDDPLVLTVADYDYVLPDAYALKFAMSTTEIDAIIRAGATLDKNLVCFTSNSINLINEDERGVEIRTVGTYAEKYSDITIARPDVVKEGLDVKIDLATFKLLLGINKGMPKTLHYNVLVNKMYVIFEAVDKELPEKTFYKFLITGKQR